MELNYEFEEKEQFSLEDVQAILEGVKGQVDSLVLERDTTIAELTTQLEGVEDLQSTNHELQIKNLMMQNGLDEDVFDLIHDKDLKVVESKIEKLKSITKQKDIDGAFKPKDKRKDDDIAKLEKDGNVHGMLKHKINRLFG